MIAEKPQMPIKKAASQIDILNDYKDLADRFLSVTIIIDEFATIATEKGYVFAEAALAMVNDSLTTNIIGTKTLSRIDVTTLFLVVNCNQIDPREVIENRIKEAIEKASNGGKGVRYSFAFYPEDGQHSEVLLQRMRATMPASWSSERGTVLNDGVDFKKEIESGNVLTYVQGVYDTERNLRGVELLARWNNQDVGIVAPSDFLDGIHSQAATSLFVDLLLNNATKAHKLLSKSLKKDIIVAINVNPLDLMNNKVLSTLLDYAKKRSVRFIEIELVESDDMSKLVGFDQVLESLTNVGYRIAIDDFGSKYAWIYSLGDQVSTIKLDRTLTQRISKGTNTSAADLVVCSIIKAAHTLGLEVIAEGVEDKDDLDVMLKHGVTGVQGYLFGSALPLDDFIENYQVEIENRAIIDELLSTPFDHHKRH